MNPLRHKFLPISFAISVIGLCFSVYNILSSFLFEQSCTTACGLFANFTIMGVSLWWVSAIFFTLVLILSLFGLAYLLRLITAAALTVDIFLLFIMLNTTLCVLCICAGILIACSYYVVRYENRRPLDPYPKTFLLGLWAVLFVLLLGSVINANQRGISFAKVENPTTNIFFSPSCPACKKILMAEQHNKNIAWYPVEDSEHDIWRILFMQERINAGDTVYQALLKAEEKKPEEHIELTDMLRLKYFVMQYKVWKNTAIVKRRTTAIPYIEVFGTPKEYQNSIRLEQSAVRLQNQTQTINSLIGQENELCGDETKPCDEEK